MVSGLGNFFRILAISGNRAYRVKTLMHYKFRSKVDKKITYVGTFKTNFGVNAQPIFGLKVSKEAHWNGATTFVSK